MAYEYEKNEWESYNENYPLDKQPDSLITKQKLDRMELGIERSSMSLEAGNIGISNDENPSVSITIDEIEHTKKLNILFPKQKDVQSGASINDDTFNKNSTWSSEKINSLINDINDRIEDLSYEPIQISSFTNNVNTVEKGNTINTITFNWSINKIPVELTLNGNPIDTVMHSTTITDIITGNTTYILRAVDEKDAVSTRTSSVSFVNGVYYGVGESINIGQMTLQDIIKELSKPGRDPRENMPKPILRSDVLKFEDLKEGMILNGTVRNITDFGAFVDIGIKNDGLVHISEMSDKYIKSPNEVVSVGDIVKVVVIGIDNDKKKVKLSMKKVVE